MAYEQSRKTYGTGDTVALAYTSNVKAGSLLVAVVTQWKSGGVGSNSSISSDNNDGSGWVQLGGGRLNITNGMCLEIFYAFSASAASCTITVNPESTSTSLVIHEFSGISTTDVINAQDTNTTNSDTPSGGPITTTVANTVIFGAMTSDAFGLASAEIINPTWVSGESYSLNRVVTYNGKSYVSLSSTNTGNQPDTSPSYWEDQGTELQEYEDGDSYSVVNTVYRILSATETVTLRWWYPGASWNWGGWVVAFKESGATLIEGSTCWGHVTGVIESNTRTFASNWTGTGTIENSGDTERLALQTGQYMQSEVVNTGTDFTVTLLQNNYSAGDTVALKYRHGASQAACEAASWNDYTVPFDSLGYVQVRVESTL